MDVTFSPPHISNYAPYASCPPFSTPSPQRGDLCVHGSNRWGRGVDNPHAPPLLPSVLITPLPFHRSPPS
ncbi:hypothetical protein EON65_18770 [archaeon]|nr:MAG: hypothetical protein EON65_18770 [archaeon]